MASLALVLWAPAGVALGQTAVNPCQATGSPSFIEVIGQRAQTRFAGIDSSIWSATAGLRRCQNVNLSWTVNATVDAVESDGRAATSGRLGVGALFIADPYRVANGDARWLAGINATLGFEDYYAGGGTPFVFRKDQRGASSAEVVGGFVFTPDAGSAASLDRLYLEARAALYDKRAPSPDAPAYATETYETVSLLAQASQYIDHEPFGSKIDYTVSRQHFFSDTLLIDAITTWTVQWRPQGHPQLDHSPDRLALGLAYASGDGYSAWTLYAAKVF